MDDSDSDDAEEVEEVELEGVSLGERLLHSARVGAIERVRALLDQGVDVDSKDPCLQTSLMLASRRGHGALVALLCERGAHVNAASNHGSTALRWATVRGHLGVVKILVAYGADVHQQNVDLGWRPLHFASFDDRLPVCEFLLSKGADLMAVTSQGWTALNHYGHNTFPRLSPETKALRCAALKAAWAAGPHPSQVQRRCDERWARRGPLLTVLAEHAYRPLQHRALALALATTSLDCARPVQQPPAAVVLTTSQQQRHAYLLGRIFSIEGIVRLLAAML